MFCLYKDKTLVSEPKQKPVNCVIKFLKDYANVCNIVFCVINSIKYEKNDWPNQIKDDDSLVNKICGELFAAYPTV